jgi:spore germination protein GerM
MPRHIKFGLLCLLLLTLAGVSYYYNLQRRITELVRPSQETQQPYLTARPVISATAPVKKVKLFFPSALRDGQLLTEVREIRSSPLPSEEAKQIVAELIAGPTAGNLAALPQQTRLRELFVTPDKLAVVDLTKEASLYHPGGVILEIASVYSVVNSLTQNVPGIEKVQIVMEGVEAETLAGHIDTSRPLTAEMSMIGATLSSNSGQVIREPSGP